MPAKAVRTVSMREACRDFAAVARLARSRGAVLIRDEDGGTLELKPYTAPLTAAHTSAARTGTAPAASAAAPADVPAAAPRDENADANTGASERGSEYADDQSVDRLGEHFMNKYAEAFRELAK